MAAPLTHTITAIFQYAARRSEDMVDGVRRSEDMVDGVRRSEDMVDGVRRSRMLPLVLLC